MEKKEVLADLSVADLCALVEMSKARAERMEGAALDHRAVNQNTVALRYTQEHHKWERFYYFVDTELQRRLRPIHEAAKAADPFAQAKG